LIINILRGIGWKKIFSRNDERLQDVMKKEVNLPGVVEINGHLLWENRWVNCRKRVKLVEVL